VIGGDKRFRSEDFAAPRPRCCGQWYPGVFLRRRRTDAGDFIRRHRAPRAGRDQHHGQHNPPQDNGFKVRDPNGGRIDPAGLKAIEAQIPATVADVQRMDFVLRCRPG